MPDEELKKRAEVWQRLATTRGELVALMLRSPRHRDEQLSDLSWLMFPPLRTSQYALIRAQSKAHGTTSPIAAVFWATVSSEVDKRLSEKLDEPIRLAPAEWKSGDILWLVEAVGHARGIAALVQRLRAREWKDKPVKARVKGANGGVEVSVTEPQAASEGAAVRNDWPNSAGLG